MCIKLINRFAKHKQTQSETHHIYIYVSYTKTNNDFRYYILILHSYNMYISRTVAAILIAFRVEH